MKNTLVIRRGWVKYRETSMASRSIICQRRRLRQIIDLRTRLGGQDNSGGRVVSASGKNCPWIYACMGLRELAKSEMRSEIQF